MKNKKKKQIRKQIITCKLTKEATEYKKESLKYKPH